MPQMSPLSWLNLYIMFNIIFMLFCMLNYYLFIPLKMKSLSNKSFKNNSMIWKW